MANGELLSDKIIAIGLNLHQNKRKRRPWRICKLCLRKQKSRTRNRKKIVLITGYKVKLGKNIVYRM